MAHARVLISRCTYPVSACDWCGLGLTWTLSAAGRRRRWPVERYNTHGREKPPLSDRPAQANTGSHGLQACAHATQVAYMRTRGPRSTAVGLASRAGREMGGAARAGREEGRARGWAGNSRKTTHARVHFAADVSGRKVCEVQLGRAEQEVHVGVRGRRIGPAVEEQQR
jgi:hypothetical protein